jgi:hypothetical protein
VDGLDGWMDGWIGRMEGWISLQQPRKYIMRGNNFLNQYGKD